MISWINGELVNLWQTNSKFFVLINCQGLGYEVQVLESFYINLKTKKLSDKNIVLWLKHIKKEDSDTLFGFITKDEKDFFTEILNIKGIGSQIGMSLLNRFTIDEIIDAINKKDKKLISSIPGIGQKMTERILLELKSNLRIKSNFKNYPNNSNFIANDKETISILDDVQLTLISLNYTKTEIKNILPDINIHIKNIQNSKIHNEKISFENLLKLAMNYLDKNNRI